ncbi:MAG: transglycosylase SLT domain-containing protein [Rhodospirillales bacterium]|jgi:hypothetical protein|nr:transglycosylase SLT domain-containing protein [Rhodospirillales bacterium]
MLKPSQTVARLAAAVLLVLLSVPAAPSARAAQAWDPGGFAACRAAIQAAARAARLPPGLLEAVAVVESGRPDPRGQAGLGDGPGLVLSAAGRSLLGALPARPAHPNWRPWPWTINADGVGQFFRTKAQAVAAVRALRRAGVQSIDVGCLQVNLRDHAGAFRSLDQAFDPPANARVAAAFLVRLFARAQDWRQAVAAYHSQTPSLGTPYRRRVFARWHAVPARPARAYADFLPPGAKYADFARQ